MNYKIYTSYHKDELIDEYHLENDDHHILYPTHKNIDGINLNHLHDHLSDFCAMYYVYKNNKYSDFVGFEHYRRKLNIDFINEYDLKEDECIVYSYVKKMEPIKKQYGINLSYNDWDAYIKIINTLYGENNIYTECLNNSTELVWDDIFMMSYNKFMQLAKFLFTIEDHFDTYIDSIYHFGKYNLNNYLSYYNNLYLMRPHMLERLTGVWILNNFNKDRIYSIN